MLAIVLTLLVLQALPLAFFVPLLIAPLQLWWVRRYRRVRDADEESRKA